MTDQTIATPASGERAGRREQNKAENRAALLKAARTVFAEMGYGAAGVRAWPSSARRRIGRSVRLSPALTSPSTSSSITSRAFARVWAARALSASVPGHTSRLASRVAGLRWMVVRMPSRRNLVCSASALRQATGMDNPCGAAVAHGGSWVVLSGNTRIS